jgi:hypothetical protein
MTALSDLISSCFGRKEDTEAAEVKLTTPLLTKTAGSDIFYDHEEMFKR